VKTQAIETAPAAKPRGRDREQTAARILDAIGEVLAREGFAGIGVNAIAKQAGVDKVLIYRYFGGLPELLMAYGQSGAFWPTVDDLLGSDPQAFFALPVAERYCRFFEHLIDALRARPLTLEILAQEVIDRNELTVILETEREQWGEQAARVLGGADFARVPGAAGVTVLLIAGVQYLLLRARKIKTFGGFDLKSDAGWDALKAHLRAMVGQWFKPIA
jgi:AcrR family transcriptional regulator